MFVPTHFKRLSRLVAVSAIAGGILATSPSAWASPSVARQPAATTYTFTKLDDNADPTFNQLLGINDQQVIAGYFGSGATPTHPNKGYTLVPPYGQTNYRNENFPGSVQTQVTGINDFGYTVGFYVNGTGANIGFVDINGTFTSVADPLTTSTPAFNQLLGINNNDVAVGFYNDAAGNAHGYEYNVATMAFTPVTLPHAVSVTATGINDQGDVSGFGTNAKGKTASFVIVGGVSKTFRPVPTATGTRMAFGINDLRQVVGTYLDSAGKSHGFVWSFITSTGQTVDEPHGIGTTVINGINNGGSIVGFYTDAAMNVDGFLGVPPVN